jgi:hypothetical protein
MRKTVIASEYTFEQINSGFAYKDSMLKKLDSFIEQSKKGIGTSWERQAVKRYLEAELQGLTRAKQYGRGAAAKIAAAKAETFAALRKALEKLTVD